MPGWKFSCEAKSDIPLPPAYSFPQAFNYLNEESNSYYILERDNGDYIQCGGSKKACCVEIRTYDETGAYKHVRVGHAGGSEDPSTIQMSDGIVHVLAREVFTHWEAIDLFKAFFAGQALSEKYVVRMLDL